MIKQELVPIRHVHVSHNMLNVDHLLQDATVLGRGYYYYPPLNDDGTGVQGGLSKLLEITQ